MEANLTNIKSSLMREHLYSDQEATALLEKHRDVIQSGMNNRSFTYYIVGQILRAEDHDCDAKGCPEEEEENTSDNE